MAHAISMLALSFCFVLMPPRDVDMKQEPPREVIITIDGKQHRTELNQMSVLKGQFKDPRIRIELAEIRLFSNAGISFEYPAQFEWEFERDEDSYYCWTMAGEDTSIMVFEFDSELTAKEYAENLSDEDFLPTLSMSPISRTLGKSTLNGYRVIRDFADPELKGQGLGDTTDVFSIPAPKGRSRLLVLTDVTPELESDTDEFDFDSDEPKIVLEYLTKSFTIKSDAKSGR